MKREFFDYMHKIMDTTPNVYFLMAGLGYPRVDEFLEKYPDRAFNTEASEQATLDMAVGLAYAGKIPVIYSITPFLLYRGFETIRTYFDHEKLLVILVGAGRDDDYSKHDGFSHFAGDDKRIMANLTNITATWPPNIASLWATLYLATQKRVPTYINIPR